MFGPPQSYAVACRRVQVNGTTLVQVAHHVSQCRETVNTAHHCSAECQQKLPESHAGALPVVALQGFQSSLLELPQMLLGLVNVAAVHRALLQPFDFSQEPLSGAEHTKVRWSGRALWLGCYSCIYPGVKCDFQLNLCIGRAGGKGKILAMFQVK